MTDFEKLWSLRPTAPENRTVIVRDKVTGEYRDKTIFRFYQSYLRVPGFDESTGKSFMFSGSRKRKETYISLPDEIEPLRFYADVEGFDNCVVNWYEPDDYIEAHSDCAAKLNPDFPIVALNFNEPGTEPDRYFTITENNEVVDRILLTDKLKIVMPPGYQEKHKHAVGQGKHRRISVTFRKLK